MTRFAASIEKLSEDGAFQEYARKYGHVNGPAEWIAALHREHHELLAKYKMSEGERVAAMRADVQLVVGKLKEVQRNLGVSREHLTTVLGETPVVHTLKDVATDLRRVLQVVEAIGQEPGA